jgi:hypothetical protein
MLMSHKLETARGGGGVLLQSFIVVAVTDLLKTVAPAGNQSLSAA